MGARIDDSERLWGPDNQEAPLRLRALNGAAVAAAAGTGRPAESAGDKPSVFFLSQLGRGTAGLPSALWDDCQKKRLHNSFVSSHQFSSGPPRSHPSRRLLPAEFPYVSSGGGVERRRERTAAGAEWAMPEPDHDARRRRRPG